MGIPLLLASIGGLLKSLDNSVGLMMPVKLNPLYIAVGFIVIMLTYELSKLLCRKKVNAVSMSEALKAETE
jgi:putative ABC transport system permease protein